ncbi:MAG: hypothetical protein ACHBN1_18975 [Heteroscytonema crispum UTEX LB 1556]
MIFPDMMLHLKPVNNGAIARIIFTILLKTSAFNEAAGRKVRRRPVRRRPAAQLYLLDNPP